jgi:hypothetical protein
LCGERRWVKTIYGSIMLEGEQLKKFYGKLQSLGEETVRSQLAQGIYGRSKAPLVQQWLGQNQQQREQAKEELDLELKTQEVAHIKESNVIAKEARDIALASNKIADSSKNWSIKAIIISSLISLASVFISLFGTYFNHNDYKEANQLSREAIGISNTALAFAQKIGEEETRPRISIALELISEFGYFDMVERGESLELKVVTLFENNGKSTARDIAYSLTMLKININDKTYQIGGGEAPDQKYNRNMNIGEKIDRTQTYTLQISNPELRKQILEAAKSHRLPIELETVVEYQNPDLSQKYNIAAIYSIEGMIAKIKKYVVDQNHPQSIIK